MCHSAEYGKKRNKVSLHRCSAGALGRGFRRPRCDKSSRQLRRRDRSRRRAADASAMPNAARVRVHGLFPRRTRIRGLGTAQGAWPCGGDRPSATGRADRAEVAVEAYSRPRPPLLPPCYHNCYPTRRDGVGKRTITERENALFSGQFGPRRDRPTRRRPNFKTAALNHSAILPTLWKYSCFPRTRMLDTWLCWRTARTFVLSPSLWRPASSRQPSPLHPPASPVRLSGVVYLSHASSSFCAMTRLVSRNGSRQRLTPSLAYRQDRPERRDLNRPRKGFDPNLQAATPVGSEPSPPR